MSIDYDTFVGVDFDLDSHCGSLSCLVGWSRILIADRIQLVNYYVIMLFISRPYDLVHYFFIGIFVADKVSQISDSTSTTGDVILDAL